MMEMMCESGVWMAGVVDGGSGWLSVFYAVLCMILWRGWARAKMCG